MNPRIGFTLIELLVVIAIVAVLAVTVILTLNPAQLLRQARDSNRIQDIGTLKSALSLYLADVASPNLGTSSNCYATTSSTQSGATCATSTRFGQVGTWVTTNSLVTTGSGWIPVNFTSISAGSPISALPVDPVNNATYFYAYRPDTAASTFELNANLESTKFSTGGSSDAETNDGGDNTALYEAGSDPSLNL